MSVGLNSKVCSKIQNIKNTSKSKRSKCRYHKEKCKLAKNTWKLISQQWYLLMSVELHCIGLAAGLKVGIQTEIFNPHNLEDNRWELEWAVGSSQIIGTFKVDSSYFVINGLVHDITKKLMNISVQNNYIRYSVKYGQKYFNKVLEWSSSSPDIHLI